MNHWISFKEISRSTSLVIGSFLCFLMILIALISIVWTPFPPDQLDIINRLNGPNYQHWLGTDHFGRDVASRIMEGTLNAVLVGGIAISIGLVGGFLLGISSVLFGGWYEVGIMRIADFTFAFPALLIAILLTSSIGSGIYTSIIAIGIFNIPVFARIIRASAKSVLRKEFAVAAKAIGKRKIWILFDHIIPNIVGVIIIQVAISFSIALLAESGLSYLGIGTQPPNASWGLMLYESRTFLSEAPYLGIFPGVSIALSVLGVTLFGDGLRDLLDPKDNSIY